MNDLIGLTRAWGAKAGDGSGAIDCCLMAAEVHYRLGYWNYLPELEKIFAKYTEEALPPSFIARWLLANGTRLKGPENHAVVLLPGPLLGALGTVLDKDDVLFIGPAGRVIRSPLPADAGWYFRLNK
jgi:hypothetical protein